LENTSLYEPIHGSYPQATGLNIANPLATILSAAMMFEDALDYMKAATIRAAVNKSLEQGIVTEDLAAKGATAYKTSDIELASR
jgi:3-isopropylmalate dehydrogenase